MDAAFAMLPVWQGYTANLTLAYLLGSARAAGFEARVVDFSDRVPRDLGDGEAAESILSRQSVIEAWARELLAHHPRVVGFSVLAANLPVTEAVARAVRRISPETLLLAGGPHLVASDPDEIRRVLAFVDLVVEGEGEADGGRLARCPQKRRRGAEPPPALVPRRRRDPFLGRRPDPGHRRGPLA